MFGEWHRDICQGRLWQLRYQSIQRVDVFDYARGCAFSAPNFLVAVHNNPGKGAVLIMVKRCVADKIKQCSGHLELLGHL